MWLDDAEHPLLGLAHHHLEGLHVGLAQGDLRDVEVDPHATLGGHLGRGGGETCSAEVLQGDEQPAVEQLERALEQLLLLEGIAHLNGRPPILAALRVVVIELGRGEHRGAADAVAAGRGAEEDHDVAGAGRRAAHEALAPGEPKGHRVHQAVLLVGRLEVHLAADRRHADRVAVVPDAGHRPVEQVAHTVALASAAGQLAEAQRVEHGDGPRADREDVAQDAPDARGGALERLDRAWVVVRLHLECADQAAADVDGAGVLARSHHHVRALGGQRAQELLRMLVGAVLAPQQRVHGQLDLVRRAALLLADELVLLARQAEHERVLDGRRRPGRGQRDGLRHGRRPRPPGASTRRSEARPLSLP